jgi:hypothetical protein
LLLNELFHTIREADAPKQLGRAFNHLEDLVFFHGTAGTREALQHIRDFATAEGASSIRMKWDGCIHKDSIILTTQGDMTIESITNLIKQNQSVIVIGKDMLSMDNIESKVIGECVSEGIKDWVEIELENSSILKMTVDHKVYTKNRGWVEAGQLTTDDDILELNDKGAIALIDK